MKKQIYFYIGGALILMMLFSVKQCQIDKEKAKNEIAMIELSVFKDSLRIFKSKTGELTYKLSSVAVEHSNTKKALEAAGIEIKNRDVQWRNIVTALNAKLEAAGHGTTILRDTIWKNSVDTVYGAKFEWNNRYLSLSGTVVGKDMDFRYRYQTDISLIQEEKKGKYIVSAYLSDPQASITTANSITVVPKKKWWGWDVLKVGGGFAFGYLIFK